MAARFVVVTALVNLALQAQSVVSPPTTDSPWWTAAEHLTLSGAMVIAIVVLWKAYQAKDALLVESTRAVTEALSSAAASNTELRGIIRESVEANRTLKESIAQLTAKIQH